MIARLADHLAHFLRLASPADRDARWDQACADLDAARTALAAVPSGEIVGDAEAAEIAARAEAATRGPWTATEGPPGSVPPPRHCAPGATVMAGECEVASYTWNVANGEFIAAARADVPRLLADRAARIAECEALRAALRAGKADALRAVAAVLEADPDCTGPLGRGEVLLVAARLRRLADDAEKGA